MAIWARTNTFDYSMIKSLPAQTICSHRMWLLQFYLHLAGFNIASCYNPQFTFYNN